MGEWHHPPPPPMVSNFGTLSGHGLINNHFKIYKISLTVHVLSLS